MKKDTWKIDWIAGQDAPPPSEFVWGRDGKIRESTRRSNIADSFTNKTVTMSRAFKRCHRNSGDIAVTTA